MTTTPVWIPDSSSEDDWLSSLEAAARDTATAAVPPVKVEPIGPEDVAAVHLYSIRYHGSRWSPGDRTGTELHLTAIMRLTDGRWASLESWNDYTGWGCQDGATMRIGDTYNDVVHFGLTEDGRDQIAIPLGRLALEHGWTPPAEVRSAAPCPDWSMQKPHDAHYWDAPVDGLVSCPGWKAEPEVAEPLIDPDCRDGKHTSCVGCDCSCHQAESEGE